MAVYVSNIVIEQGFDFETTFELENAITNEPLDLSTYNIPEAKLRKNYSSSTSYDFTGAFVDELDGKFLISMGSSITSQLKPGRYVYDVKLTTTATGLTSKAVEGSVIVRGGVTK